MNPAPGPSTSDVVRLLTNALADAAGRAISQCSTRNGGCQLADLGLLYHAPRPDVLVAPASALRRQVGTDRNTTAGRGGGALARETAKADLADKQAVYFTHGARPTSRSASPTTSST